MTPAWMINKIKQMKSEDSVAHVGAGIVAPVRKRSKTKSQGIKAKGGKGGKAPTVKPNDPMQEANAQIKIQEAQAERDRIAGRQTQYDTANNNLSMLQQFMAQYDPKINEATERSRGIVTSKGLNWDEFDDPIISAIRSSVPKAPVSDLTPYQQSLQNFDVRGQGSLPMIPNAPDISALNNFDPTNVVNNTLNDITSSRRNTFKTGLEEFAGQGKSDMFLNDWRDDAKSITDSILGDQYQEANNRVLGAQQRGNLTATGFQAGQKNLDNAKSTAQSRIDQIVNDIFSGQRNKFEEIGNQGRTDINNYQLGQQFSVDPYKSRWTNEQQSFSSGLDGLIRSALSNESFFNTDDLISKAGVSQGVSNGNRPLFDAFAAQQKDKEKSRGLGQQGVF